MADGKEAQGGRAGGARLLQFPAHSGPLRRAEVLIPIDEALCPAAGRGLGEGEQA